MKNDNFCFKENRLVMFAGEKPGNIEAPQDPTARMGEFVPPKAEEMSAGSKDPEVAAEAGKIKAPQNTDEAAPIYDKYIDSVQKQIDSFTKIEERFDRGGHKDPAIKRKLIAAVEAAGGVVSTDEYFPRPSNTLYQTPGKGEYGYGDLIEELSAQGSSNDLQNMVDVAADGYSWHKFRRQMVAINKRMQAAKTAYDTTN